MSISNYYTSFFTNPTLSPLPPHYPHPTFISHWSRREEADFYRIVSTYGVELKRVKKDTKIINNQNGADDESDDVDVTSEVSIM